MSSGELLTAPPPRQAFLGTCQAQYGFVEHSMEPGGGRGGAAGGGH